MTIRVVQWTTGVVGTAAVRATVAHPELTLVGCYAHSPDKVGVDVGVLSGIDPLGIRATNDVDALLSLKPDCVVYMPLFPNIDHLVRILEAGCNIVSTAYFVTGSMAGERDHARIVAAARRGKASIYGSGIYPGLANVLALVGTAACARIDKVSVLESVDATAYASAGTWLAIGFARPIDDPEAPRLAEKAMPSFKEAVEMMADALKVPVDEIRYDVEFAAATEDVDLGYMKIDKGCISALRGCWSARVDGRPVIELKMAWKLGDKHVPDWPLENGYLIEIEGTPSIRCRFEPLHEAQFDPGLLTAMPAIHAIPAVCAAPAGIVTAAALPLVMAATRVVPLSPAPA